MVAYINEEGQLSFSCIIAQLFSSWLIAMELYICMIPVINTRTGGCSIAVLQFYHKSYVHHRPAQCKLSTLSNTSHSTAALLYTASPNTTDITSRNTWATHAARTVIHLQLRIDVLPLLFFLLAEGEFHITHILLMHRWWNRKKWKKHRHSWTYPHSQGC